jgi:hypothetical protein
MLNSDHPIAEFVRKARDAGASAAAAADPFGSAEWARIARRSRGLAQTVKHTAVKDRISDSPSPAFETNFESGR